MEASEKLGFEYSKPNLPEEQKKMAADLLSKGLIDPAYAYAMSRAKFLPQYVHQPNTP
jgi:hypothetical protein